ncbi:MAG: sigma factor-like helix-turn-helix DNA-binding protein [Nitrososphaerales archaeon]
MAKSENDLVGQLQTLNALVRALLSVNLESLKLKQSDKIWLLYSSGLPIREVAQILGVSANNVAVTIHNLKKNRGARNASKSEKD